MVLIIFGLDGVTMNVQSFYKTLHLVPALIAIMTEYVMPTTSDLEAMTILIAMAMAYQMLVIRVVAAVVVPVAPLLFRVFRIPKTLKPLVPISANIPKTILTGLVVQAVRLVAIQVPKAHNKEPIISIWNLLTPIIPTNKLASRVLVII